MPRHSHAIEAASGGKAPATGLRLSVVIPVYNGASTIGSLLDSLLSQRDTRCEIIVVDDCSTDSTATVLRIYANRGVTCLRTARNSGPAAARNLGAAGAAGDTLLFFDSDDVPSPVLLPTVLATLEAYPDAAFGGYLLAEQLMLAVDRSVLKHTIGITPSPPHVFPLHAYAAKLLVGRRLVTASSVFVRKSLFDAHGGFVDQIRMFEDPELFARLSAVTPFVQIPEVLAIYRIPDIPPAERTRVGVANAFIHTVRKLAERHGARYQLLADVFALRMAVLARAFGAPARACLTSLKEAGVGALGRAVGGLLVVGASPSLLRQGVRLYRHARRLRRS
jgi:glycosyltransferase involved in cell wall biosynthesis